MKTIINMDPEMIEAFFEIMVSLREENLNFNLEQIVKYLLLSERDRLRQKSIQIILR